VWASEVKDWFRSTAANHGSQCGNRASPIETLKFASTSPLGFSDTQQPLLPHESLLYALARIPMLLLTAWDTLSLLQFDRPRCAKAARVIASGAAELPANSKTRMKMPIEASQACCPVGLPSPTLLFRELMLRKKLRHD
jgi:hypothetical protein